MNVGLDRIFRAPPCVLAAPRMRTVSGRLLLRSVWRAGLEGRRRHGLDPLYHPVWELYCCGDPVWGGCRDLWALPAGTRLCAARLRRMGRSGRAAAAHDPCSGLADSHGGEECGAETLVREAGAE